MNLLIIILIKSAVYFIKIGQPFLDIVELAFILFFELFWDFLNELFKFDEPIRIFRFFSDFLKGRSDVLREFADILQKFFISPCDNFQSVVIDFLNKGRFKALKIYFYHPRNRIKWQ